MKKTILIFLLVFSFNVIFAQEEKENILLKDMVLFEGLRIAMDFSFEQKFYLVEDVKMMESFCVFLDVIPINRNNYLEVVDFIRYSTYIRDCVDNFKYIIWNLSEDTVEGEKVTYLQIILYNKKEE